MLKKYDEFFETVNFVKSGMYLRASRPLCIFEPILSVEGFIATIIIEKINTSFFLKTTASFLLLLKIESTNVKFLLYFEYKVWTI